MIVPTLGRIVWFKPSPGDMPTSPEGLCGAMIVYVHSNTLVNLAVFDANGTVHGKTSVPLIQEGAQSPGNYYCQWMPYQIGQAQRTEDAEKALASKK